MRDVVSVQVWWVIPGWLESPWLQAWDAPSFQVEKEENTLEPQVGGTLCELELEMEMELDLEDEKMVDNNETSLELQGDRAEEEYRSMVVGGRIECDLGSSLIETKHKVDV